ncbi:hypothetical protein [Streptomyces sp. NBC_01744]|uniref:hypothetical protein n=1 Tax=Streptomyces sp. NBC_01744 TaxID=2975927 RepID=UPI003D9A47A1|nr:helix-turn-helix domain-containing protein [Streptomyces sp. NBC_01744]
MSTTDPERKQAPRTAWINALRGELLRVGKRIPELARVVSVGVWIATYADADGSHSFPGRDTLACLAGCSEETVTRAVKVLMGVGALQRKRRPNASSMYQLVTLLAGPLPWEEHMHHMTDTRQRKAHAKKKAEAVAKVVRKASVDAVQDGAAEELDSVRGCGPDSVHGGGSESSSEDPDSVHGRPRTTSTDAFRTASVAGVYKVTPTSGRDPRTDKELVGLSPQVQQRAGARGEGEFPQRQDEAGAAAQPGAEDEIVARRCACGQGHIVRADRDLCGGCLKDAKKPQKPVQGAFLVSLAGGGQGIPQSRREPVEWPTEDPTASLRVCACGREHRLRDSARCPQCVVAAAAEEQRLGLEAVSNA